MGKLSTLQLLRLLRDVRSLSDVPDIHEEAACRIWLKGLVVVLWDVAPLTETAVDDEAVNLLALIAENDTVWTQVYDLIFLIVSHEALPLPGERMRELTRLASEAGCDETTAAEAVDALSELFTP